MAHHFGKHDQFSTPCAKAICLHGTCKALFKPNDCCMCDIIKSSARFWRQTLMQIFKNQFHRKGSVCLPQFFFPRNSIGGFFHNKEHHLIWRPSSRDSHRSFGPNTSSCEPEILFCRATSHALRPNEVRCVASAPAWRMRRNNSASPK